MVVGIYSHPYLVWPMKIQDVIFQQCIGMLFEFLNENFCEDIVRTKKIENTLLQPILNTLVFPIERYWSDTMRLFILKPFYHSFTATVSFCDRYTCTYEGVLFLPQSVTFATPTSTL